MGKPPDGAGEASSTAEIFNRLLEANRSALGRLAASYTRSTGDHDDLLQEIALALWRALPGFRGECAERTFLFRIAHNRCMTYLSKRKPTISLDGTAIDALDPRMDSDAQVSQEQERQRLLSAVHRLPLLYREVIVLMLEGLDYREISEVVGTSETNVGVRLNRARQQLRQLLEDLP